MNDTDGEIACAEVATGQGFSTGFSLDETDLARVRSLIRTQWLARVADAAPSALAAFEHTPMDRYHEIAHLVDHKTLWPKSVRILPAASIAALRTTGLFQALEAHFGSFRISNEERIEEEEAYWRLVRPDSASDVGPIHADRWFWDLGHGTCPPDVERVKVWIAIHCETGQNGFIYVPDSHKRDWPYHGEMRDGMLKPQVDFDPSALDVQIFASRPGDAIVFNDGLLHGGTIGGCSTRVSLEFTMFVDRTAYQQRVSGLARDPQPH